MGEHCLPCTVVSFNAEHATKITQQQGFQWLGKKKKPQATPVTEAPKIPAIRSVVNVPPWAASSHAADGVPAMLLDHDEEEEEESFHEFHQCRMM